MSDLGHLNLFQKFNTRFILYDRARLVLSRSHLKAKGNLWSVILILILCLPRELVLMDLVLQMSGFLHRVEPLAVAKNGTEHHDPDNEAGNAQEHLRARIHTHVVCTFCLDSSLHGWVLKTPDTHCNCP